ncbi:hypothetical protein Gotur_025881 [Gossypium turneri]
MENGNLLMDHLENIMEKEQVNPSQVIRDWVNELKTHWKELDATLLCDGWTNNLNQMHIISFLVYCSKGTVFWKSVDVSSVHNRDAKFYYTHCLDLFLEDIGKKLIVPKVLDEAKKPLVKVLKLVDGDEKSTMDFIYEAVDRAKRAIRQDCRYFIEYE